MKKYLISLFSILTTLNVLVADNIQNPNTQKQREFDEGEFRNPPAMFRPVPFWSWNEVMEPAQVKRQIREMKKAGWGGAFVHSRIGLVTPYLGKEWFAAVDATLEECQKQGMKVWLYDEDKWPSGFNGGTVPLENQSFRLKTLFARNVDEPVSDEAKPFGLPVDGIQVYAMYAPMGDGWFNGTSYVDTMSEKAMNKFRSDAYESYYDKYKEFYGNLIVAEFTDEPSQTYRSRKQCELGAVPFSADFMEAFKKAYSYDPTDHLYKLFVDTKDSQKFRLQYYRILDGLFEKNFSKNLGNWCAERGIALTGHYMAESPMYYTQQWMGRVMPNYRHMGIPGIDHLCRRITEPMTAKQCSSVVNQYGKERMLSELYGCTGGSLSFEDRKWIALEQITLGVNLLNPHLSLYTMTGCRKRDYPQNIYYQQSWWDLNRELDDPLSRICYTISLGKYKADILVLHPHESVQALWKADKNPKLISDSAKKEIDKIQASSDSIIKNILSSQLTFDYADEQLLEEDGFVDNNKIGISKMTYRAVVIPEMETIRPSTFEFLKEFQTNGGVIFKTSSRLKKVDGVENPDLVNWLKSVPLVKAQDLPAAIEEKIPSPVKLQKTISGDSSKIWTHIRDLQDGTRLIMLVNLSRFESFEGEFLLRGNFTRALKLDTETAKIYDVFGKIDPQGLRVPIKLAQADSIILRLQDGISTSKRPEVVSVVAEAPLQDWSLERLDDNSITLDYAHYKCIGSASESGTGTIPVIEIQRYLNNWKYDGGLVLTYPFKVQELSKKQKVNLVLEYPERCEIKVNGKSVEYDGLPAWRDFRWLPIDISKNLKEGENTIELTYKNFQHGDPTKVSPAFARYGTEIESIYLVGDFSVNSLQVQKNADTSGYKRYEMKEPSAPIILRDQLAITNPKLLDKDLGDTTLQGLPFYTGRLKYSTFVKGIRPPNGTRLILQIENLDCPVAEVIVNGERAGVIKSQPLQVDITDAIKADNANIDIILYASLRNLLGPHHNKRGELVAVGPSDFYSHSIKPNLSEAHDQLKKWGSGEWTPNDWISDYCMHSFGQIGDIKLITIKSSN